MNQEQTWLDFQQMMAQQQQNMMLQFQLYLQFCQKNGLVFGDPNPLIYFFNNFHRNKVTDKSSTTSTK